MSFPKFIFAIVLQSLIIVGALLGGGMVLLKDDVVSRQLKTTEVAYSETDQDKHFNYTESLKDIVETVFAARFKYPSSVEFTHTNASYERAYGDNWAQVSDDDDIHAVMYCGQYTAKNGRGMRGQPERFYARIVANNENKTIGWKIWYELDGEVKKSLMVYPNAWDTSGDKDEFKALYDAACADSSTKALGRFADYEIESVEADMFDFYSQQRVTISGNPTMNKTMNACLSNQGELQYCISEALCADPEDENKENYCQARASVCTIEDTDDECGEKVQVHFKAQTGEESGTTKE